MSRGHSSRPPYVDRDGVFRLHLQLTPHGERALGLRFRFGVALSDACARARSAIRALVRSYR